MAEYDPFADEEDPLNPGGEEDPDNPGDDDDDDPTDTPSTSTPGDPSESIPMSERTTSTTRPREKRKPRTAETSFITDTKKPAARVNINLTPQTKKLEIDIAQDRLKYFYPNYEKGKIKLTIGSDGQVYAESRNGKKMIRVFSKKNKDVFLKEFKDEFEVEFKNDESTLLGPTRKERINVLKRDIDSWKKSDSPYKDSKISEFKSELEQIEKMPVPGGAKSDIPPLPLDMFELEDLQRSLREKEVVQDIREQEAILNDENSTEDEKTVAREKKLSDEQELTEVENEREEEIERLSLADKLRVKVKEIFKKYGFTITAVLLAVGTVIGVIVSSLSKGLAEVSKGVGNGLKNLGKKIAGILPGLLGSIVGFVFRAAGEVVSFLGKNAWLLIVAAALFLFERLQKRNPK